MSYGGTIVTAAAFAQKGHFARAVEVGKSYFGCAPAADPPISRFATERTTACEQGFHANREAGGAPFGPCCFRPRWIMSGPGRDLGDPPSSVVVDVLVPVAVDTAYSYRAPADWGLEPGTGVRVPLGTRQATGVVWAVPPGGGDNLKSVAAIRDWQPLHNRCAISSTGSRAGR